MAAVLVKRSILKLFQSRQLKLFAIKVAKFRTGKICPEITFTICTKQFHLMKNGHEGLKLMVFEETEQEFPFRTFLLEKQDHLFRCSVAPGGNFSLERPKKSPILFTLQPDFPEIFVQKNRRVH